MKTRLISFLTSVAALGLFSFSSTAAVPTNNSPSGLSVRQVNVADNMQIARGSTQTTVRRLMGAAHRILSPDVWVYYGFHSEADVSGGEACNQLVVTFADGKVTDLKIVNDSAVQIIAASVKPARSDVQIAKK